MHGTNDNPTTVYVIPKDKDILCAHRKFCYKHQGNVRFRVMIATQLPTYIDPQTTRKERASIIDTILEELYQDGCSFLRKGIDGWFKLSKKEAREKVAHSMRDARGEMKRYVLKKNALNARRERNSDATQAEELDEDESNVADFLAKQASERTISERTMSERTMSERTMSERTMSDERTMCTEEEAYREEEMRDNSYEDVAHTDSSQEFQQYTADDASSSQQFQSDNVDAASSQESEQQMTTNTDENKTDINPTVKDILCGQGKICYDHVGNQNFRKIIDLNLPKYLDPKRSKSEKTAIIENITEWLYDEGCNFLRESSEGWVVLSKHEGREKVAHALRDAKFVLKRRESKSPNVLSDSPPPVTSDYNFLQRDANMTDIHALATGINILNSMGGENRSSEIRFIENAILGREGSVVLPREYEEDVSIEALQARSANMYNAMLNEGNGVEITTCDYRDFIAPQPPNVTVDILSHDNNNSIAGMNTLNDVNLNNTNGNVGLKPVFGCVVFSQ